MTAALRMLAPARQADVIAAVCAVEHASAPVPLASFRALAEPALREVVAEVLAAAGRVLLTSGSGFLSGYDDRIADQLAEEGTGVLRADDRAVLTLVVLFSIAIPQAEGRISREGSWTRAQPVPRTRLENETKIHKSVIGPALTRLQDAGIVRYTNDGIAPGPQFDRLTPAMSASLFEELVLLAEPEGALAESIRRRRHASRSSVASKNKEDRTRDPDDI
jgi:hypothetical protein